MERWPWHCCQGAKVDQRSRRSCRQRPLEISGPARQGLEDQLKPDSDDNERAVLTGGDTLSSLEQRCTLAGGGWGGVTEAGRSSGTCTRGWKASEAARHRRRGETEVEHGGDGLPESRREAAVGHGQNEWEGPPFIAAHHTEQCGPVEGGDGSVRWHSGKAGMRSHGAEAQQQWVP
jgi:hypothetical protein